MDQVVIHCGQLVTMAGPKGYRRGSEMRELDIVPDGAFAIKNGRIEWVGTTDEAPEASEVIDAKGQVVTPGLIDAHTHLVFAGCRANELEWRCEGMSYREIAQRGGGIRSTVNQTRGAFPDDLKTQTHEHAKRLLRCGTTSLETKTGYGLSSESELAHLEIISSLKPHFGAVRATFLGAHAVPPEFENNPAGYLQVLTDILPKAKEAGAEYVDAFVEEGYLSQELIKIYLAKAKDHGLGIRLHVDQMSNQGGANFASQVGATTADHLEHTDDKGIQNLMKAGVTPVLLPGSVLGLGLTRYPDAKNMIEAGLPVVLATDFNPGSSPTPSLPLVMALACRMMKMTPSEALTACTMNAAASLGLHERKGSIEVGKDADFLIWPFDDYQEIACWFGDVYPKQVFIAGDLVLSQ